MSRESDFGESMSSLSVNEKSKLSEETNATQKIIDDVPQFELSPSYIENIQSLNKQLAAEVGSLYNSSTFRAKSFGSYIIEVSNAQDEYIRRWNQTTGERGFKTELSKMGQEEEDTTTNDIFLQIAYAASLSANVFLQDFFDTITKNVSANDGEPMVNDRSFSPMGTIRPNLSFFRENILQPMFNTLINSEEIKNEKIMNYEKALVGKSFEVYIENFILRIVRTPLFADMISFMTFTEGELTKNTAFLQKVLSAGFIFRSMLEKLYNTAVLPWYTLFVNISRRVSAKASSVLKLRNLERGRFQQQSLPTAFKMPISSRSVVPDSGIAKFVDYSSSKLASEFSKRTDMARNTSIFFNQFIEGLKNKWPPATLKTMQEFDKMATTADKTIEEWLVGPDGTKELENKKLSYVPSKYTIYRNIGGITTPFFSFPVPQEVIFKNEENLDKTSLTYDEILKSEQTELIELVEAAQYLGYSPRIGSINFKKAADGSIIKGQELYIGAYIDPYTGRARLPPKPQRKFVNPIDRRALAEYKIARYIYAWNLKEKEAWQLMRFSNLNDDDWLEKVRKTIGDKTNYGKWARKWVLEKQRKLLDDIPFLGITSENVNYKKMQGLDLGDPTNIPTWLTEYKNLGKEALQKSTTAFNTNGGLSNAIKMNYAKKANELDLESSFAKNNLNLFRRTEKKDGLIEMIEPTPAEIKQLYTNNNIYKDSTITNPARTNVANSTNTIVKYLYNNVGGFVSGAVDNAAIKKGIAMYDKRNLMSLTKGQTSRKSVNAFSEYFKDKPKFAEGKMIEGQGTVNNIMSLMSNLRDLQKIKDSGDGFGNLNQSIMAKTREMELES